ncbi:MAG: caspase family protein, partial [Gammaproteobacteria bacterium]|nr:caspase family protein [Gammaproteobacteria bacterium]
MKLSKTLITLLLMLHSCGVFANERVALIIGNENYKVSPLKTAVNDASAFANTLSQIGFQVNLKTNASQPEMEAAVQAFGKSIQAGAIGLFYYAGHAVQHDGENYLVPINAISSITAPEHLRYKTVPLGYVLGVVNQSASDLNVVILDSCRNSPFKSFSRDLTRGITRMPSSEGTLI